MHSSRLWLVFSNLASALLLIAALPSQAIVNVDRTRLVFNQGEVTQSLMLANDGTTPTVMQVWLDTGNPQSTPDSIQTPLVVMPPVFRILPGEVKSLRVMLASRQQLIPDRENLFWLNLYQIPPTPRAQEAQPKQLILPLRLRLKVLVRPVGVGVPQEEDGTRLRFRPQGSAIAITNPTPWFISMTLTPGGQPTIENLLVPPGETLSTPLPQPVTHGQGLTWEVINDTGNRWVYQGKVG